jgi:hypothetical protein
MTGDDQTFTIEISTRRQKMNETVVEMKARIGFLKGPRGDLANQDASTMISAVTEIERLEKVIAERDAEINTLLSCFPVVNQT